MKLVVILGPTASGKSDLAVKLARRFFGEIVSADSRQVYKGLNIGSGKITKKEMWGIPHHLLNVANPRHKFSVAHYQKLARSAIKKIHTKGKVPFLVGGTGLYIQAIVDGLVIPEVKPNWKLRKKLEKKTVKELYEMLLKLDPVRATNIDAKNPRRLIRALEINLGTGEPVEALQLRSGQNLENQILQIGIKKSPEELKKLIAARLKKRLKKMVTEVNQLHKNGLSWKRLEELGLEYRFVARLLQGSGGQAQYQEMVNSIQKESEHFAKRQMTWFGRDQRIHWVKNYSQAEKLVKKFL